MKTKNILLISCLAISICSGTLSLVQWLNSPKIAYVNLSKLYNSFNLKKELEQNLSAVQDMRNQSMDSLRLSLSVLSNSIQSGTADDEMKKRFEAGKSEYMLRNKNFSEDNDAMAEKYDNQVWEQLNQYVTEYGNQHNFTVVVGGDGSGAVMFAKDKLDVTDDLIAFANSRFDGKKTQN